MWLHGVRRPRSNQSLSLLMASLAGTMSLLEAHWRWRPLGAAVLRTLGLKTRRLVDSQIPWHQRRALHTSAPQKTSNGHATRTVGHAIWTEASTRRIVRSQKYSGQSRQPTFWHAWLLFGIRLMTRKALQPFAFPFGTSRNKKAALLALWCAMLQARAPVEWIILIPLIGGHHATTQVKHHR